MKPAPPVIRTRSANALPPVLPDATVPRGAVRVAPPRAGGLRRACRAAIQLDRFGGTSNAAGMRIVPDELSLPERPFSAVRGPAPANGKRRRSPRAERLRSPGELTSNERR